MSSRRRASLADSLALALALITPATASAQALTADSVAAAAARTSFDVRARDRDLSAAAAAVDQALVALFPRLTLAASYTRLSDLGPFVLGNSVVAPGQAPGPIPDNARLVNVPLAIPVLSNSTQVSVTLTVPLSDYLLRIPQTLSAADHSRDAARSNLEAARRRAAFDGRITYFQWVRALHQVDVANRTLAQARDHLADVERMVRVGSLAHVDELRAQTQVANAELLVTRAESLRDATAERIRAAMHLPDGAELSAGEDLTSDVANPALPPSLAAMVDEAVSRRPELRALASQRSALDAQSRAARAAWIPNVAAVGQVLDGNPNPRVFPQRDQFDATWSVGVSLSYTPNDIAAGVTSSRSLAARAAAVEAQSEALRDALRSDLAQATTSLRESAAALATTARALESAEEAARVRRELFRNGRATTTEVTDAETDLLRARIERENALVDRRVSVARVEYLLGRPDPALR